jgi:PhoH-like ATPase
VTDKFKAAQPLIPYIESSCDGLSYCVEKLKGQKISAHITLTKGERSSLAELAELL